MLERYPEYWRGWADTYFDGVPIRVLHRAGDRLASIEHGGAYIATTLPLATVKERKRIGIAR